MGRLKLFALAIGSWIFAPSLAAQSLPEWVFIPCENSPADAVLEMPEPLNQIASVQCTVFGHAITGSSEYIWSLVVLDGGSTLFVPAQEYVDGKLTENGHDNFFTSITAEEIESDRLEDVYLTITGHRPDADDLEILSGSLLRARNQRNFETAIFVAEVKFESLSSGEETQMTWGWVVRSDARQRQYPLFTITPGTNTYIEPYYSGFPLIAVQPDYPERAISEGIEEGYCTIAFTITTTGTTKDHELEDCSNAIFEQVSIRAAESLRYRPRISYWRTVEANAHYKFTFELKPETP